MDTSSEPQLAALREIATEFGLTTLVLRDTQTLSWLTGARSHVQHTLDRPCFDVVIDTTRTPAGVRVVSNVIELDRLRSTELSGFLGGDFESEAVAWSEDRASALPRGASIAWETGDDAHAQVAARIRRARRVLTPSHRSEIAELGTATAAVVESVLRTVRASDSERTVAARVTAGLLELGIEPIVCMVGAGARQAQHRHPLPTAEAIGSRVMVSVGVRRRGVVASVTRHVVLIADSSWSRDRYLDLLQVEAAFLDATRPGATLGEIFRTGTDAYRAHGFAADEWHNHHQGGLAGFAPRDVLASSTSSEVVELNTVVAWNPSGAGWKVEDSCLVTESGVRVPEIDSHWPQISVAGRARPDFLQL